ncbi:MAG: fused response regulator/phosphatase [Magnetococcales bacterium]|nr:fused response regulator/phosphatase [Magnetococcales bacterium]
MSNSNTDKQTILVVDDTAENLDVLKGALLPDFKVRLAPNGKVALKAANVKPHPDLVLLDIMMPIMDGFEVCRRLKASEATKDIPVIFVTAKTGEDDELEGLKLGAVDYITKPISIPIVRARVNAHLELRKSKQQLDRHNKRLLYERELIEKIILKMRDADVFDNRNLRYLISPVEETAGDMLISTFTPDGRQLVLLGDFTGHGLPAAIGGPLVTYILYELAMRGESGESILSVINSQLYARLPTGIFFAAFFLEISPERDIATIWNAAIPDGVVLRKGDIVKQLPSNLLPLGVTSSIDTAKAANKIPLETGDRIFIFSDGIVEARGNNREMFGYKRIEDYIKQLALADENFKELLSLLNNHVGSSIHDDDITLAEIRF